MKTRSRRSHQPAHAHTHTQAHLTHKHMHTLLQTLADKLKNSYPQGCCKYAMQTVIMGNLSCRAKKPSLSLLFLGNQADRRKRKEEDEDTVSDFVRTEIPCSIFDCPALIETVKQLAYNIISFVFLSYYVRLSFSLHDA